VVLVAAMATATLVQMVEMLALTAVGAAVAHETALVAMEAWAQSVSSGPEMSALSRLQT